MMNPFPFPPKPQPTTRRMWKQLGLIAQSYQGWVEAHYALDTFNGDLDVDREAELRQATLGLMAAVTRGGIPLDPNAVYALQTGRRALTVRLQTGRWDDDPVVIHQA